MASQSAAIPSIEPSSPFRITVVHHGALGDFLLSLPVFDGLYLADHRLKIDFCSKSEHIALIRSKPYVGDLYSSERTDLTPFFHEDLWQKAQLPIFFENSEAIFIFGQTGSRAMAERLSRRVGVRVYWVRSFPDTDLVRPVSRFLVEQVQRYGWLVADVLPQIDPPEAESVLVKKWMLRRGWPEGVKPVMVHPGSGGRKKIWPLQRWWALLRWLSLDLGRPVVMALGPADELLRDFAAEAQKLGVSIIEHITLTRLAAFLRDSCAYIGNDSGVTHLAAAVGIPTIAVFGPTSPEVWAPLGPHVHLIRSSWKEAEILEWTPHCTSQSFDAELKELVMSLEYFRL
ncbi:MAG: glycosyltransferase family 9 protein [Syntrophobacteraceae bacterium]